LSELGWYKLDLKWIKKLNKLSSQKEKNSRFGKIDFQADGDCLFHCIAFSLSSTMKEYYDASDIRKLTSEQVTDENFSEIIMTYRILKDSNDFEEYWDPYEIEDISQFKKIICEGGHNYWGDHVIIQLLMMKFKINILILESDFENNVFTPYLFSEYNKDNKTIILEFCNKCHFCLIGYFENKMISLFENKDIPVEIKRLYNIV
jgi:hypothetical protein